MSLIAAVLIGPRVIEGRAALEWTRHFAGRGDAARAAEPARQAARWAARALERSAPFPAGSEAARLALSLGRSLEATDPAAALRLYGELRGAIDGLAAWRRIGLGGLADEARSLEERARRAVPASPGP